MKKTIITIFAVMLLLGAGRACPETRKADLLVEIRNVPSTKGNISIALSSDEDQYNTDEDIYRAVRVDSERPRTVYVFEDIPYGRYALKLYHDKNGDHQLNKGFFGMPKERYGFSNNPKVKMSMPSYEECAFDVDSGNEKQIIEMR